MIHLSSFEAIHYRGIDGLSLPKLNHVNLITGENGVGKTALIEAIWLFMGRYNPRLLWNGNVQRSSHTATNPVSELSSDSVELRGTEDGMEHPWRVAFDPEPVEQFVPEFPSAEAVAATLQLPFAGRLQTWIDDKKIDAKSDSMYRTSTDTVLYKRSPSQESKRNCVIEGTRWQLEISEEYLKLYSDMVREGRKEALTNAVNLILPNVKDIQILTDENGESYLSAITDNGAQRRLENLGGGIVRLLKLYLNFFAVRNGVVLIDEVENGLHYSVLRNLWDRIRIWTCEWNVQFIATTHSAECIDAAMEAFADEPNDLSIHNLFANESRNIKAATFTGEALEGARNLNLEVR